MMDIVYVGAFRLPKYDAAAARVISIGKALRDSGHKVSYISWGGKYDGDHKKKDGMYYLDGMRYVVTGEMDGVTFLEKARLRFLRGNKTIKVLRSLNKKPDVIITYNVPCNFNIKILKYCRINKIKLVADITEWYDNNELKTLDVLLNWINMTIIYKNVPNIIGISHFIVDYYKCTNSIVMPALADKKEKKWGISIPKDICKFDGITLIYAGNPRKKDKLHFAIAAVQKLINEGAKIRFLIAGCERNKYMKIFSQIFPKIDLSSNILFLGRIDQDKIPSLYAAADFMVLLRENNRKSNAGFPTKFTEAMVSGTPVICNLTSDLGKYIKDGSNGFIVKDDSVDSCVEILKNKILVLSRKDIEIMKENARNTGINKLDYRNFKEDINNFITNLV